MINVTDRSSRCAVGKPVFSSVTKLPQALLFFLRARRFFSGLVIMAGWKSLADQNCRPAKQFSSTFHTVKPTSLPLSLGVVLRAADQVDRIWLRYLRCVRQVSLLRRRRERLRHTCAAHSCTQNTNSERGAADLCFLHSEEGLQGFHSCASEILGAQNISV